MVDHLWRGAGQVPSRRMTVTAALAVSAITISGLVLGAGPAAVAGGPAASDVPASGAATSTGLTSSGAAARLLPDASRSGRAIALPVSRLSITDRRSRVLFNQPTQVTSARDGRNRTFVVQRNGLIRMLASGRLRARAYVDLRAKVNTSGGEQGLLGVAFPANFVRTRYLFVSYVRGDGALVIGRLRAARATSTRVAASTLRRVLVVPHPSFKNHNGGSMAFGRDGFLYLGTGDGGGRGDPFDTARNLRSLRGKILRIDVSRSCGSRRYCIPATNPYATSRTVQRSIIARGVRNPWRISIDRGTGDLWIGDVGQDKWEEIDRIPYTARGRLARRDFGWSCREGNHGFAPSRCAGRTMTGPVTEICHPDAVAGCAPSQGGESVTGGFVYRGTAYRSIAAGTYIFADFITGHIWGVRAGKRAILGVLPQVTSFGESDAGELLAVTYDGRLHTLGFAVA